MGRLVGGFGRLERAMFFLYSPWVDIPGVVCWKYMCA